MLLLTLTLYSAQQPLGSEVHCTSHVLFGHAVGSQQHSLHFMSKHICLHIIIIHATWIPKVTSVHYFPFYFPKKMLIYFMTNTVFYVLLSQTL